MHSPNLVLHQTPDLIGLEGIRSNKLTSSRTSSNEANPNSTKKVNSLALSVFAAIAAGLIAFGFISAPFSASLSIPISAAIVTLVAFSAGIITMIISRRFNQQQEVPETPSQTDEPTRISTFPLENETSTTEELRSGAASPTIDPITDLEFEEGERLILISNHQFGVNTLARYMITNKNDNIVTIPNSLSLPTNILS
jgi:hypothetical protein